MSPEMAVVLGLIAHGWGDYILQSDYMANEKTAHWSPAIQHGLVYAVPFLPILWTSGAPAWALAVAMAVIAGTHIPIDHWRLARYVIWAKNQIAPRSDYAGQFPGGWRHPWDSHVSGTGYHVETGAFAPGKEWDYIRCYTQSKPAWMSTWLMFIADNTIHVTINTAALWWAVTR